MKTIGVLALQGDFEAHQKMLERVGATTRQIRKPTELAGLDGLVIPGGESTTLIKLLNAFGFIEPIRQFFKAGKGIFGTCAGSILLAKNIAGSDQFRFGFIDIRVQRNGYGRQIQSFEKDITVKHLEGKPMHAVFIRAPKIESAGSSVEVLAKTDETIVAAREKNVLVSTFHPEITEDTRLHEFFVKTMA